MSFASFVTKLGDAIGDTAKAISNSGIGTKVGKVGGKTISKTGKIVGKTGFKVGMGAINTSLAGANFVKDNYKQIGRGLKTVGAAAAKEANELAQAGAGVVELIDRSPFIKKVGLEKSLIKRGVTKPGAALAFGVALAAGSGKATKEYINDRQGTNDGRLYSPTTQMSTPYMLSEQMAYGASGSSYNSGGGADGDLVRALHNMK